MKTVKEILWENLSELELTEEPFYDPVRNRNVVVVINDMKYRVIRYYPDLKLLEYHSGYFLSIMLNNSNIKVSGDDFLSIIASELRTHIKDDLLIVSAVYF